MRYVLSVLAPAPFLALCLTLCLTLYLGGCSTEQTYEVRGRVVGFGDDPYTMIVEHEEIPGYMSAMTMPFEAADSSALDSLRTGDAVSFELVVDGRRSWARDITRLPDDAVARHPAGSQLPNSADPTDFLEAGQPLPTVELTSHADTSLTFSELRGRPLLVTFVYTSCPVPDFCPLMSRNFAAIQDALPDDADLYLVSISFDPMTDTPEVLREYANRYTDDLSNWTFATGDSTEVRDLANRFGVFYMTDGGQIVHNLVTALVDRDGIVREIWRGNDWTTEDVLRAASRIREPS